MGNDQPALHALFACKSDILEPENRLEHTFVLLKHRARQMAKFTQCSNSFCHFHFDIIRVSRPQRHLSNTRRFYLSRGECRCSKRRVQAFKGRVPALKGESGHNTVSLADIILNGLCQCRQCQ
jgi:hypothetical protein